MKRFKTLIAFSVLIVIFLNSCSTKINDSVLLNVANMTEFIYKTRVDVNQMLGDEVQYFKAASDGNFVMIADVYVIEDLSLEAIQLYYHITEYMFTDLSLDTNCISYQGVENDSGMEENLGHVTYVFSYDTADEAERIWGWVYEQKEALREYFGRTCDFEYDIAIRESLKDSKWPEINNWGEQWIFNVEGSDKRDHWFAYFYKINVTDKYIVITLDTNESYTVK